MDHNEIRSTFHLFCAALGDMPQTALSVNFRHIFSQEGRCGGDMNHLDLILLGYLGSHASSLAGARVRHRNRGFVLSLSREFLPTGLFSGSLSRWATTTYGVDGVDGFWRQEMSEHQRRQIVHAYIPFNLFTFYRIALQYIALHYITCYSTTFTTLRYIKLHRITSHRCTSHYRTSYSITLHYYVTSHIIRKLQFCFPSCWILIHTTLSKIRFGLRSLQRRCYHHDRTE